MENFYENSLHRTPPFMSTFFSFFCNNSIFFLSKLFFSKFFVVKKLGYVLYLSKNMEHFGLEIFDSRVSIQILGRLLNAISGNFESF